MFIYFFPNMMPAVCFTAYIGFKLTPAIDLATGTACLMFFSLMQGPMTWVPMAVSDFIQLAVSMKRVHKFLEVDEVQPNIRVAKKMGQNALKIRGSYSWGFEEKKDDKDDKDNKDEEKTKDKKKDKKEEKKEEEVEKPLKDYMALKEIDLQIQKGSFVCIIGDVGSGKSSLFSAVIGDMIHIPEKQIEQFGGFDKMAKKEQFDKLKKEILAKDFKFEPPVELDGSLAYVEQNAWI